MKRLAESSAISPSPLAILPKKLSVDFPFPKAPKFKAPTALNPVAPIAAPAIVQPKILTAGLSCS